MLGVPAGPDVQSVLSLFGCEQCDSMQSLRALFVPSDLARSQNILPTRKIATRAFVTGVKLSLLGTRLADGRADRQASETGPWDTPAICPCAVTHPMWRSRRILWRLAADHTAVSGSAHSLLRDEWLSPRVPCGTIGQCPEMQA